jgi:phage baseplate assembly protein W
MFNPNTHQWVQSQSEYDILAVGDLLNTRLGTRTMRRNYGWGGLDLLDAPRTDSNIALLCITAVEAIARWYPLLAIDKVTPTVTDNGIVLNFDFVSRGTGLNFTHAITLTSPRAES